MQIRPAESAYCTRTGTGLSLSAGAGARFLKAIIAKGRSMKFQAAGRSMTPFIRDGDLITLSPPFKARLDMGDVVGIIDPLTETLVVHRIVGIRAGKYWIKGDNTSEKSARFFDPRHIYARVTRIERNGKSLRLGLGAERRLIAMLSRTPPAMRLVVKSLRMLAITCGRGTEPQKIRS